MEVWINAYQHPGYEISSYGRIRNKKTLYVLKPFADRYGYLRLSLGSKDNVYIHRLMCLSFYGEPDNDTYQVNHIDGNKANNRITNLEWCTCSENISWGVSHGRIDPYKGLTKAVEANQRPVKIIELDRTFESVRECAAYLNVEPTNVTRCLRGSRKGQRLHGYRLEYV